MMIACRIASAVWVAALCGAVAAVAPVRWPSAPTDSSAVVQAGFLQLDGSAEAGQGAHHFYLLVNAADDATEVAKGRLILWLNGGPGCSSLRGFLEEHGPFFAAAGPSLQTNPNSWHHVGNVLYLESPTGVGFSWSSNTADYKSTDASTAAQNLAALQAFLREHPQYRDAPLYVSGESYAGHYLIRLAEQILLADAAVNGTSGLSLAGIALGNAYVVPEDDNTTLPKFANRALIPPHLFDPITEACHANYACYWAGGDYHVGHCSSKCKAAISRAMSATGHISIYNVYADVCWEDRRRQLYQATHSAYQEEEHEEECRRQRMFRWGIVDGMHNQADGAKVRGLSAEVTVSPCVNNDATRYFNRADVRAALGVTRSTAWAGCASRSSVPDYHYTLERTSQVPIFLRAQQLAEARGQPLRTLVYSGSADACVPTEGSYGWVSGLGLPVVRPWHAWTASGRLGGYAEEFEGDVVFATVHGAGHMVPTDRGDAALHMLGTWLDGGQL